VSRLAAAVSLAASYVVGAFPTAELVGRAYGRDVHREGSGNPGATNTYRVAGPAAAAVVAGADVAKGALSATAGCRLGGPGLGAACGVAAVVGHCFPPSHPGDGGKGVATTAGMVLALDPVLAAGAALGWAGLAKLTRRVSLASVSLAAALPLLAAGRHRPRPVVAGFAAASAVIVVRHAGNIRRLLSGQERSIPTAAQAAVPGW